jgi:predicted amidohydrolase YtcJ
MNESILFINGKVWNVNGKFTDTIGIRKNKIVFVGTNDEAMRIKDDFVEIIDVNKRVILPGLNDCHVHLIYGSLMKKRIDCSKVKNIGELSAVIGEYRKKNPELDWLVGGNINLTNIAVKPNFIDEIVNDMPVYIVNYDYHSGFCNTLAYEKSGLNEAKDKFSCDEVILDESGIFTGVVKERAMKFIFNNLPQPSLEFRKNALKDFISVMHSYGITAV